MTLLTFESANIPELEGPGFSRTPRHFWHGPAGVGRNSGTCHCDGDKVYIRYGAACSMRQLRRDVCRVAHMVSIAESAQREDAASSPWLSVRAVGIAPVVRLPVPLPLLP